jgi:uncharacterized protein (DUF952 family)
MAENLTAPESGPLFHITTATEWAAATEAGRYAAPSLAGEGFIHTSTARQVPATAARFYADVDDLVLLEIDADAVAAEIRWESSHDDLFPHIYGPLEVSAVVAARPFGPEPDGTYRPPAASRADR